LHLPPSEVDKLPATDLTDLRRLYRRCPFGPLRGDLQAWLVARNVAEVFGRGLRPMDRAELGLAKHPKRPRKTNGDGGMPLELMAALIGCPFTPGPGVKRILPTKEK
jgi:hypothetical protein